MADYANNIKLGFTKITTLVKSLSSKVGNVANLTTNAKSNLVAAINELKDTKQNNPKYLHSFILDEIVTPGLYIQDSAGAVTSSNKYPSLGAIGVLTVTTNNFTNTVMQSYLCTDGRQFVRSRIDGTWTAWDNDNAASKIDYTETQSLTDSQQNRAQENLGVDKLLRTNVVTTGSDKSHVVRFNHIAECLNKLSTQSPWVISTPFAIGQYMMLKFRLSGYLYGSHDSIDVTWTCYLYSGNQILSTSAVSTGTSHPEYVYLGLNSDSKLVCVLGQGLNKYYSGTVLDVLVYPTLPVNLNMDVASDTSNWSMIVDTNAPSTPPTGSTWYGLNYIKSVSVERPVVVKGGSTDPVLKYTHRTYTATNANFTSTGGWTGVPHGLSGNKIKSIECYAVIPNIPYTAIPPEFTFYDNTTYSISWNATDILLAAKTSNPATILANAVFNFTILHEE